MNNLSLQIIFFKILRFSSLDESTENGHGEIEEEADYASVEFHTTISFLDESTENSHGGVEEEADYASVEFYTTIPRNRKGQTKYKVIFLSLLVLAVLFVEH